MYRLRQLWPSLVGLSIMHMQSTEERSHTVCGLEPLHSFTYKHSKVNFLKIWPSARSWQKPGEKTLTLYGCAASDTSCVVFFTQHTGLVLTPEGSCLYCGVLSLEGEQQRVDNFNAQDKEVWKPTHLQDEALEFLLQEEQELDSSSPSISRSWRRRILSPGPSAYLELLTLASSSFVFGLWHPSACADVAPYAIPPPSASATQPAPPPAPPVQRCGNRTPSVSCSCPIHRRSEHTDNPAPLHHFCGHYGDSPVNHEAAGVDVSCPHGGTHGGGFSGGSFTCTLTQ